MNDDGTFFQAVEQPRIAGDGLFHIAVSREESFDRPMQSGFLIADFVNLTFNSTADAIFYDILAVQDPAGLQLEAFQSCAH